MMSLVFVDLSFAMPQPISVTIGRSDSRPELENVKIKLVNLGDSQTYDASTDMYGMASFYVPPGSYELSILPSESPDFYTSGIFKNKKVPLSVMSSPIYYNHVLEQHQRLFHVGFFLDQAKTQPVVNQLFTLTSATNLNLVGKTDSTGYLYAGLLPNVPAAITVRSSPSGYLPIDETILIPSSNIDYREDFFAETSTATIEIELRNGSDNSLFIVPDDETAKVDCIPKNIAEGLPIRGDISSSQSTVTLQAYEVDEGFRCFGHINSSYEIQEYVIEGAVNSGDSPTVVLNVYSVDGQVEFEFIDKETGEVVREPTYEVTLHPLALADGPNSNVGHLRRMRIATNDSPIMTVPTEVPYEPSVVIIPDSNDQFPSHVLLGGELESFTVPDDSSTPHKVQISVVTLDSVIQPLFLDADKNSIDGVVRITVNQETLEEKFESGSRGESEKKDNFEIFAEFKGDSPISIPVLSEIPYQVKVAPVRDSENDGGIVPGIKQVIPKSGETVLVTRELIEPNYTLTVSLSATDPDGNDVDLTSADVVKCTVRTPNGQAGFGKSINRDSTIDLSVFLTKKLLQRKTKLGFSCIAIFREGDNEGAIYQAKAEHLTKAKKKQGAESLKLNYGRRHHPEQREGFAPSEAQNFPLPGGKMTLEAGAGVFNKNTDSEYLELSITSTEEVQPNDLVIVREAFKFSLTDDEGNAVTEFDPIEVCDEISDEDLAELQAEYGASLTRSAIQGAFYDTTQEEWQTVTTTSTGNKRCFPIDHFSSWGTIIDVLKQLQEEQLDSFTISKRANRKGRVLLRWDEPDEETLAAVGSVTYEVQYSKKVKKKACADVTDFPLSTTTETNKARIRVNGRICGRVLIQGGTAPTDSIYRKVRSRK